MIIAFTPEAWEDYLFWQLTSSSILVRINTLIKDISRSPRSGIGKPEQLKWEFSGCWSRRIDQEHRIVYKITPDAVHILSCRYHY
jgi:toxin YoeB